MKKIKSRNRTPLARGIAHAMIPITMTIPGLKIRLYGDPCLRRKSDRVEEIGPAERLFIKSMIVTMHEGKGVGLAAPQVGVNRRIFVADIGEGPEVFINLKILKKSRVSDSLEEGCLCMPGVTVNVKRPTKVVVEYTTEDNKVIQKVYDGLMARVVQHENDHLDGKLIVDYAGLKENAQIRSQLKEIEERFKK